MGVRIRNLKTDSKSEFEGPKTVEERIGCARGQDWPKWPTILPRESHVSHTWTDSLCPRVAHTVHTWDTSKGSLVIFVFESLNFEFVWKSYDQNKILKIVRKILISNFASWNVWEGIGDFKGKRRGKTKWPKCPLCWCPTCGPRGPHVDRGALSTCGSRGAHVATMQGPFGRFVSRALSRFFGPYLGRPNSDFESVFGLQIVTPIRTTKTKKLCKNVEKSSRKTTSKTTQRMRMQSSIATSFGLET